MFSDQICCSKNFSLGKRFVRSHRVASFHPKKHLLAKFTRLLEHLCFEFTNSEFKVFGRKNRPVGEKITLRKSSRTQANDVKFGPLAGLLDIG